MLFMWRSSIRYLLFPNRCLQVLLIHIPMQHPSVSIWRMGTHYVAYVIEGTGMVNPQMHQAPAMARMCKECGRRPVMGGSNYARKTTCKTCLLEWDGDD